MFPPKSLLLLLLLLLVLVLVLVLVLLLLLLSLALATECALSVFRHPLQLRFALPQRRLRNTAQILAEQSKLKAERVGDLWVNTNTTTDADPATPAAAAIAAVATNTNSNPNTNTDTQNGVISQARSIDRAHPVRTATFAPPSTTCIRRCHRGGGVADYRHIE